jgi:hypothetical protein
MRVAVLCPVQPTGQRIRTLAGIEALEWSRRHESRLSNGNRERHGHRPSSSWKTRESRR